MTTAKKTTVSKRALAKGVNEGLDFAALVSAILHVHAQSTATVSRVINTTLTLRNWMIGAYLHHYELNGQDRAKYGDAMIDRLATELAKRHVSACERQRLYSYLAFFRTYPQMASGLSSSALSALRLPPEYVGDAIVRSLTGQLALTGQMLLDRLSYTHLGLTQNRPSVVVPTCRTTCTVCVGTPSWDNFA